MSPRHDLDDYELADVIGVGSVGTVYRGTHLETGQAVAIKRLHESVAKNELIRERFKREINIMGRLHHPNIVAYVGGKTVGKDLYYTMELVTGGSVKEIVERTGPLPWQATVELGIQVCSALQFAHNHGVVHRDLKPSNLFVSIDGILKLGDFGIARDLNQRDLTTAGVTVGTHAYMAPEQIKGDDRISGQADLYGLGCCLFEMMTGRHVFFGENRLQIFDQHLKADPPSVCELNATCPSELNQLIQWLLKKNPEDRPFNARQAQASLLRMVEADRDRSDSQLLLRRRIENFMESSMQPEVSWAKIGALLVILAIFVVIVSILSANP